jgi:hypothetical protein
VEYLGAALVAGGERRERCTGGKRPGGTGGRRGSSMKRETLEEEQ